MYDENTPEAVAKVLLELLSSPKKREEFGKESQKLARRFTEKRQVSKLAKLYEDVVADYDK
jgi:glycosyltransferase involved in cell wall biosynthesis